MPIFNEQTNLAGQGRFSPGVTYYAGIRAPVPAAPRIEKGQYSFNIDMSPIANAYINSQELKAKKYEAEAERDLRMDLANMENARAYNLAEMTDRRERELQADRLSQEWQIAKMNDETNRLKIAAKAKQENEKSKTTQMKNLAVNGFFESEHWKQHTLDLSNPEITPTQKTLNLQKRIKAYLSDNPELTPYVSYDAIASAIYNFGGDYTKVNEKAFQEQYDSNVATGAKIDQYGTKEAQYSAGIRYNMDKENAMNLHNLDVAAQSDPNMSPEDKENIHNAAVNAAIRVGDQEAVVNLRESLKTLEPTKLNIAETRVATREQLKAYYEANGYRGDIESFTDMKMEELGFNRVFDNIEKVQTGTFNLSDNQKKYINNNAELYWLNDEVIGPFLSLPTETRELILNNMDQAKKAAFASYLGSIMMPHYVLDGDTATVYGGLGINTQPAMRFSQEQLNAAEKVLGKKDRGALALSLYWKILNNRDASQPYKERAAANTYSVISGGKSISEMSPEEKLNFDRNIDNYMNQTNIGSLEKSIETFGEDYGRLMWISRSIASSVSSSSSPIKEPEYYARIKQAQPEGLSDETLRQIAGSDKKISPEDIIVLKSDKVYAYKDQNNNIMLDYDQNGILSGVGLPERNRAIASVSAVVVDNAPNDWKTQLVYYRQIFPKLEMKSVVANGYFSRHNIHSAMDLFKVARNSAVGTVFSWAGELDTGYQDILSDIADSSTTEKTKTDLKEISSSSRTEEDRKQMEAAFNMLKKDETTEKTIEANARNMLTNEAAYIKSAKGWEDRETDGINYSRLVKDGVLHIQIGNDSFSFYYPLDISEEELVADLKNNPKETVTSLSGSWSRKL